MKARETNSLKSKSCQLHLTKSNNEPLQGQKQQR